MHTQEIYIVVKRFTKEIITSYTKREAAQKHILMQDFPLDYKIVNVPLITLTGE